MKIREIMTSQVDTVSPDTSLKDAARMMRDADIGFLPVGENDRLVGTLTDRDIAVRAVANGKDPNSARVREAMSSGTEYVFEDQDTNEAARIMSEKQIRRLPVLNRDKRLVGGVAIGDLATKTGNDDVVGHTVGMPGPAPNHSLPQSEWSRPRKSNIRAQDNRHQHTHRQQQYGKEENIYGHLIPHFIIIRYLQRPP